MRQLFNEAKLKPKTHLSVDTQTWIRGKTNGKGYFTLQNKATGKLLTFATSSQTKLAGLYNHIYVVVGISNSVLSILTANFPVRIEKKKFL